MTLEVSHEGRADLGIGALELFVEVLSQSEAGTTVDGFYDHICEAVCRLARMRRALIFRYDSADRRVRAVGAHGMDIEQFSGAYVTVESAPIAAQAIRQDRVVEVVGDLAGQVPEEFAALVSEPARLVCAPMAAADRAFGVILADRLMHEPPLDEADRRLLWTLGKAAALASVARIVSTQFEKATQLEQRIDLAREIHEGVIQRLFGVSMALDGDGELPAVGAPALRRGDPGGAHRAARRAAAPAGPRSARHQDHAGRRGRAASRSPIPTSGSRWWRARRPTCRRRSSRWRSRCSPRRCATPASTPSPATSTCGWAGPTGRSGWRWPTTAWPAPAGAPGMGLRLAALEALQSNGVIEFGEREPGTWQVRLVVPDEDDD